MVLTSLENSKKPNYSWLLFVKSMRGGLSDAPLYPLAFFFIQKSLISDSEKPPNFEKKTAKPFFPANSLQKPPNLAGKPLKWQPCLNQTKA